MIFAWVVSNTLFLAHLANTAIPHAPKSMKNCVVDVAMLTGHAETPVICVMHQSVARLSIVQVCVVLIIFGIQKVYS